MTTAQRWARNVSERDHGRCAARKHDPRCRGQHEETHHIVYRSHLTKGALWEIENGIALSLVCHQLAHRTHNANISPERKRRAVDAVNAIMPPYLRRPHFEE